MIYRAQIPKNTKMEMKTNLDIFKCWMKFHDSLKLLMQNIYFDIWYYL